MKTIYTFVLVAFMALLTSNSSAQATGSNSKVMNPFMTFTIQVGNPIRSMNLIGNDLVVTGEIPGIANSIPNGQTLGFNGIVLFLNYDLTHPIPLGSGINTPTGKGVNSVTRMNGTYYASADDYASNKLFQFDGANWNPLGIQADTSIMFIDSLDATTLVLIGPMHTVNGVTVNGICTYDVTTNVVTPVGSNGLGTDWPVKVRNNNGIIEVTGRSAIHTFSVSTRTLINIQSPSLNFYYGFIVQGDTMFVLGIGSNGSEFYRKVSTSPWELVGYNSNWNIDGITELPDGKIALLGDYTEFTTSEGSTITGTDLVYDEKTGAIQTSPVTGLNLGGIVVLPNSELVGYHGGSLFTTENLVPSSVNNLTDQTVTLYPNPATNYVVIDGVPQGEDIVITDITGKIIDQHKSDGGKYVFNTQNVSSGLLFVNKHKLLVR